MRSLKEKSSLIHDNLRYINHANCQSNLQVKRQDKVALPPYPASKPLPPSPKQAMLSTMFTASFLLTLSATTAVAGVRINPILVPRTLQESSARVATVQARTIEARFIPDLLKPRGGVEGGVARRDVCDAGYSPCADGKFPIHKLFSPIGNLLWFGKVTDVAPTANTAANGTVNSAAARTANSALRTRTRYARIRGTCLAKGKISAVVRTDPTSSFFFFSGLFRHTNSCWRCML